VFRVHAEAREYKSLGVKTKTDGMVRREPEKKNGGEKIWMTSWKQHQKGFGKKNIYVSLKARE